MKAPVLALAIGALVAQVTASVTTGFAGIQFTNPPDTGATFPQGQGFNAILSYHSYIENFQFISAYFTLHSTDNPDSGATFIGNGTFDSYSPPQGYVGASNFVIEIPEDQPLGNYNLTAYVFGAVAASYEPVSTKTTVGPIVVQSAAPTKRARRAVVLKEA